MPRVNATVPPDAIRIEDEVWQEAFRETTRPRNRSRLRSHDGDRVPARPVRARPGFAANATATLEPEAGSARADASRAPLRDGTPARRSDEPPALHRDEPLAARTDDQPARRTVTITGRGAERNLWAAQADRRRPARRPHERAGFKSDRIALWAVFLGMLLICVAAASAHT
jgi:hypothetical protein